MKKIVCHLTSVHQANDIRIFHKECISLVEHGYEVHLVAQGSLLPDAKGVTHHALIMQKKRFRLLTMIIRSWRAYRLAKSIPATVFHIHDPELLPYGLLLKWQGNIVIYDAHEDLPRDVMMKNWIPKFLRKPVAWLVEKIENFIARRINVVIAATPRIFERFKQIGVRTIEVRNYPKLNEFSSITSLINVNDNLPKICYVGMISLQRGIIELISAIETMNVQLIIAGAFADSKTEIMARALPGWQKVDFRGTVSRQEIAMIFAQSSMGICVFHPTAAHIDALPNKLFEYMSAGLPIVASDFLLWRTIVEKEQCGLCVNPMSILHIKNAIQWILDNPTTARQMGLRGKSAVEEQYHWDTDKLIGVYQRMGIVAKFVITSEPSERGDL